MFDMLMQSLAVWVVMGALFLHYYGGAMAKAATSSTGKGIIQKLLEGIFKR